MPEFEDAGEKVHEARRWRDNGWTARVIKNDDDDGWAVAMTPEGQVEPALVGPWTMGRDKKNPKPLDSSAFNTLVKTAAEFVRRHEQQLHATLHQQIDIAHGGERFSVSLDIEPDDENPSAMLRALDAAGELLVSCWRRCGWYLPSSSTGEARARGLRLVSARMPCARLRPGR